MTAPHPAQEQDTFDLGIEFPGRDTADIRQWRLEEVQIANWGTMDGRIHRFPVSRRGHLITGPSGSGKSSILDAIAAVLTPDKWLRFNQAAQGGAERTATRGLVSYVRGAWTRRQDEDEDRVSPRTCAPGPRGPASSSRIATARAASSRCADSSSCAAPRCPGPT